ncbi:heme A synthase [Thioclava sp. SK-1]|uniref:heme A synthase n=1 Tax=Thioclava sp. SK-1 TaxID=1889770 RepID=UPI000826144B|nr:heme A synthase [Thioclava sp. SK-1]OCX66142.1 heme A synthase [Thioclava sp. SK-1]
MSQKRSIFEEVGSDVKAAPALKGGMINAKSRGARRGIRAWLAVLFVLVLTMIAVGGATRLTDSGLSITEWKPLSGAVPPMTPEDWAAEFQNYQQIPQYELLNANMTLQEFKGIYWWEWGHRQLGRVIGLVWALGFFGFWIAGRFPTGWVPRLLGLGVLGGLQGAIGWWMVSSGLTGEMVAVASYRLAVHLGLAFVILGLIAWYAMQLSRSEAALLQARRLAEPKLFGMATGMLHLAFVQILLGALTAGIDAGRGYTDWPLMGGYILPPDPFSEVPLWKNFFENAALVQFNHRIVGYLLFAFGVVTVLKARRSAHPNTRQAFLLMGAMLLLQVVLGVVTLLHGAPVHLGLAHQFGAVLLWVMILRARHHARYPIVQSVRGA